MMAEYIEREALIKQFESNGSRFTYGKKIVDGIVSRINMQPAVDVVEVVRCKDCKYRKTAECLMYVECDCGSQHTWECDNDFCSYGERRCEE